MRGLVGLRVRDSRMPGDPVGVPGCAVVEGERLLPGRRVVGEVLPGEADLTGTPSKTSSHSNKPTPSRNRPTTGGSRWPSPTVEAHQIRQSPVGGSNSRSENPSNPGLPGKRGAENVSMFPSPPRIGPASVYDSNSIHSVSPRTSGLTRLRFSCRQLPKKKSKSCRPSSAIVPFCACPMSSAPPGRMTTRR